MCGQAGSTYYFYRHRYAKLGCQERMVQAPKIEAEILEVLTIALPALVAEIRAARERLAAAEESGGELQALAGLEAEMERLISLRLKALITEAEFEKFRAETQEKIARLIRRLNPVPAGTAPSLEEVEALLARLPEAKPGLQKEIIHSFLERVEVAGQRVTRLVPRAWCAELFPCGLCSDIQARSQATQVGSLLDCQ